MKTVTVYFTVTGNYQKTIEVADEMTKDEIETMFYNDFPAIEEYYVEVEMPEEDEDDDFDYDFGDDEDEDEDE